MGGILLISVGEPFYRELTINLILSLRAFGYTGRIAVITDNSEPYPEQLNVDMIPVNDEHLIDPVELYINPFRLKTYLNDYSPYIEETLYLDSDLLLLNNAADCNLFPRDTDFQMHEVARYTKDNAATSQMIWCKTSEIWDAYGLPDGTVYPEYNSSFIYWKNTERMTEFFEQAKKNYYDRRLKWTKIGRRYPDELAFNLTSAQLDIYGAIERYRPIYFDYENKGLPVDEISKRYALLGLAGGYILRMAIRYYDNLVNKLRRDAGLPNFKFNMLDKMYHEK